MQRGSTKNELVVGVEFAFRVISLSVPASTKETKMRKLACTRERRRCPIAGRRGVGSGARSFYFGRVIFTKSRGVLAAALAFEGATITVRRIRRAVVEREGAGAAYFALVFICPFDGSVVLARAVFSLPLYARITYIETIREY